MKIIPTERFTNYAESYVKYRPDYPRESIAALIRICELSPDSEIADIGSGTGILTADLLQNHLRVSAVEPNQAMRQYGEQLLYEYDGFRSVDGSAEETTLPDNSIDLIIVAQAFHWFNNTQTMVEFSRILKPRGWFGLIWNRRDMRQPLLREYDEMLRSHAPDYDKVNHMNLDDSEIAGLFDPTSYQELSFDHFQEFDEQGFLGRMGSSSYVPKVGTGAFDSLTQAARQLFAKYQENETIRFQYVTRLYLGMID